MTSHKISMYRGDSEYRKYTINDKTSGDPLDITGSKIIFTVRSPTTESLEFEKKSALAGGADSQIEILDPGTDGQFRLKIEPADTEDMSPGSYDFDIEIEFSDGFKKTIVEDSLILRRDITT